MEFSSRGVFRDISGVNSVPLSDINFRFLGKIELYLPLTSNFALIKKQTKNLANYWTTEVNFPHLNSLHYPH